MRMIYLLLLSFIVSGCFISKDIASWEQTERYDSVGNMGINFKLRKAERFITLPFLFINHSRKNGVYIPEISIITDRSVKSIREFKFKFYDTSGKTLLADYIQREVGLNDILDYRALLHDFGKEYFVKELLHSHVGQEIRVDYEFIVLYFDGRSQKVIFDKKKLILIRERGFGSFL